MKSFGRLGLDWLVLGGGVRSMYGLWYLRKFVSCVMKVIGLERIIWRRVEVFWEFVSFCRMSSIEGMVV